MGEKSNNYRVSKRTAIIGAVCVAIVGGLIIGSVWEHGQEKTIATTKAVPKKKATPSLTKEETFLAKVDLSDWRLPLVGPDYQLEKEVDEATDLAAIGNFMVNKQIVADYQALAAAAEANQDPLVIISAYRSVAYQQQVLDAGVQQRMATGMTQAEALADAKKTMTEPGHSEHHTGLAMDVVDTAWYTSSPTEILHSDFGNTEGGRWLAEHAPEYGFIIRYPEGKEAITKIEYEPWHLRYVGQENAAYITEHQLTFEEFIEQVKAAKEKTQQISTKESSK